MSEITFLEAIREGLTEEMERDPNVFCLGEDIGAYGGAFKVTEGLQAKFGEARVMDTPISEGAIIGAAAGAAHMGMRPVCEMQFIDFISCGYDMLTNYVATARYRAMLPCPMVVRGPSGGYVRGGPVHSQNPEAAFLHTPGLKMVYPATASDAKDISIITYAATVWKSLEAAAYLEKEAGLSVEVVDLRTIAPMDDDAIL